MRRALAFLIAAAMLFMLAACEETNKRNPPQNNSGEQSGAPKTENASSMTDEPGQPHKILIAYFSRTGNTQTIAEHILTLTRGELFEIKTAELYPEDYNACLAQASEELSADYRPELSTHVSGMDDYDVVFIGYPIWHGNTPMAIRSFLEEYDLSGKTVIPFCTSGSSSGSQSVSAIRNLCPDSEVLDVLCINSSNLGRAYELVEEWIDGLDIKAGNSSSETVVSEDGGKENSMTNISITVGNTVFPAKLYDNAATKALIAQFPMTLNMSDMNRNEKYYNLAGNLPSESTERPAVMNAGDIMCWSGNCLVLFYETFSNSYGGYVRLGYVEDTSGLAAALGGGNVQVTFAVSA